MMEQARISVVIAVYNGAPCVARALDSVFAQSLAPSEVIVVDDGSTDSTPQVLAKYGNRIRVIRQENKGLAAARNVGIAAGSAPYVALLDADDVWLPGRLEKTFAALDSGPDATLAYSDAIRVDERDQIIAESCVPATMARAPSFEELLQGWELLATTTLFRRDAYLAVGGFCEQFKGARGFEDVWFFLLVRERGRFIYVPEPLARYRILPFVDRWEKYAPGFVTFSRLVRERYGETGNRAILQRTEWHSQSLVEIGMRDLAAGRMRQARRALRCAALYKPLDRRTTLRRLRAYLPGPLALVLTSRKRRVRARLRASAEQLNYD